MIPIIVTLTVLFSPFLFDIFVNKNHRSGPIALGLFTFIFIGFATWMSKALLPYLPSGANPSDQAMLQDMIQKHVQLEHPRTFYTYQLLWFGLWIYGVGSAIFGMVRRRHSGPPAASSSSENPS